MRTEVELNDYIPDYSHVYETMQNSIKKTTEETNRMLEEVAEEREKIYNDKVNREKRMIELLESIDKNTSILSDMLILLQENTNDQKEILNIMNEFNALATIKDKAKAESTYRKIMNKINTVITDVDTINTLYCYGMTIYNTLKAMGKI